MDGVKSLRFRVATTSAADPTSTKDANKRQYQYGRVFDNCVNSLMEIISFAEVHSSSVRMHMKREYQEEKYVLRTR